MPSVEATSRPRPRHLDDESAPPSGGAPRPSAPPPPSCRADQARDQALRDACHNAKNDRILYLGMNAESRPAEVAALSARGASVTTIAASSSSIVELGGHAFDLAREAGSKGFAAQMRATYGLDAAQEQHLAGVLAAAPAGGRDELAKIALAWAPAERGASIPSRLVLSGHSSGGALWGDGEVGMLHLEAVRHLGCAFPAAAAQIEDIHVSGCFSEREVQAHDAWTTVFPNAKTIWAYGRFAPHAPTRDLGDWEGATRGRAERLNQGFVAAHGSATAWSRTGGIVNATMSLDDRRALAADADTRFAAFLSGDRRIADPHQLDADRDYGAFQMLAAHHEATPAERGAATEHGAQMLRLRFWETSVRGEIASHYGAQIDRAFALEGLPPVDLGTLSRKDALAAIETYRTKHGSLGPILTGLVNLEAGTIPASWCH